MPQMFPLLWFPLFMSTSILLMVMASIIFFSSKPNSSSFSLKPTSYEQNWKW